MLNTRELEKRWLHYKLKSYIPHIIITVSLFVIILIIVLFTTAQKHEEKPLTEAKQQTMQTKQVMQESSSKAEAVSEKNISTPLPTQEVPMVKETLPTSQATSPTKQIILTPSMNFMKHIQSEEQQPIYKTLHKKAPVVHKKSKPVKRTKVIQQQDQIEEEYIDVTHNQVKKVQREKVEPRHIISIERKDSEKDIQEIIGRFKQNNNPALSLFVAKKYYELGNYEQAYNYALITNGINNDIEESWIIFAKSLVKLHKRDMALKTLAEYIKYSHSGNAKILFNDIRSGKFK